MPLCSHDVQPPLWFNTRSVQRCRSGSIDNDSEGGGKKMVTIRKSLLLENCCVLFPFVSKPKRKWPLFVAHIKTNKLINKLIRKVSYFIFMISSCQWLHLCQIKLDYKLHNTLLSIVFSDGTLSPSGQSFLKKCLICNKLKAEYRACFGRVGSWN